MTQGPLKLEDAEFWTDPARTRAEVSRLYVSKRQEILLFDASGVVSIDTRASLPTQALRVATFRRLREQPFDSRAVIVVSDFVNNITNAAMAVASSTREAEPPAASNSPPLLDGIGTETFTIELRERLNLPWQSGRFQVRLIIGDQMTAAREIELKPSTFEIDPEVEHFKAEQHNKTRLPLLMPAPSAQWVSYARDERSPPLSAGLGMALNVQRGCALDTADACMLRGSFRLPVLQRHIVPTASLATGAEALGEQWATALAHGRNLPSAVVPITLVAVGSEMTGPVIWHLVLPVLDALDISGTSPVGAGTFAIDLRQLESFGTIEQRWFIYAFFDQASFGPMTVSVTRRP